MSDMRSDGSLSATVSGQADRKRTLPVLTWTNDAATAIRAAEQRHLVPALPTRSSVHISIV